MAFFREREHENWLGVERVDPVDPLVDDLVVVEEDVVHDSRSNQLVRQRLLPTDLRDWLSMGLLPLFLADVVGQLSLRPSVSVYTLRE